MRFIKCDRCGSEIPQGSDNVGHVAVHWQDIETGDLVDSNPFQKWELCEKCMAEISNFIKTMPKPEPEQKSEPISKYKVKKFEEIISSVDAGVDAGKKPVKRGRPTIDVDKAQALRDAGWTVEHVAEELKCSTHTIMHWTHNPKPRKKRPHEWSDNEPVLEGKLT